jgi:hypothetical protein
VKESPHATRSQEPWLVWGQCDWDISIGLSIICERGRRWIGLAPVVPSRRGNVPRLFPSGLHGDFRLPAWKEPMSKIVAAPWRGSCRPVAPSSLATAPS